MSSYDPISCPSTTIAATANSTLPIPEAWTGPLLSVGVATLSHPFEYAKVLIQIGHEPLDPTHTKTWFLGKPALALPSVFTYMKHIRHRDGYLGLYRGYPTSLIGIGLSTVVSDKVKTALEGKQFFVKDPSILARDEEDLSPEEKRDKMADDAIKKMADKMACIILTQPFHVCTVRAMAQFVGNESKYDGVFGNIIAVYQESGILGNYNSYMSIDKRLCL